MLLIEAEQIMQIVTDSGTDASLPPEQMAELNIHVVPLVVTLNGKSCREGVDIRPGEFYSLLAATDGLPNHVAALGGRLCQDLPAAGDHRL